jgi:hypothetical protein
LTSRGNSAIIITERTRKEVVQMLGCFIGVIIGAVMAGWFVNTSCFEKIADKIYDFIYKS